MVPRTLALILLQLSCCVATTYTTTNSSNDNVSPFGTSKACQPRHVHLSVGRTQNATHSSMTVSFSIAPFCVLEGIGPIKTVGAVRVGDSKLVAADPNNIRRYNASRSERNHYFSDVYYHIEIKDLRPDQEYIYECLLLQMEEEEQSAQYLRQDGSSLEKVINYGDDERIISRGDISTFHTPPAPGQWPLDRSIKFAVLGDLATKPHSRETIRHLDNDQGIDCIFLVGDLSYANNHHRTWDDWMDMMSKFHFFRAIPSQIALGNHDFDTVHGSEPITVIDGALEIGLAYESRFLMPHIHPPIREHASLKLFTSTGQPTDFLPYEYGNAYYSFTFGPSKLIVLSSYSSFREGSLQHDWLLSELKIVNRSVTPWLIVILHCPLYTTFQTHHTELFTTEAHAILEPIFVKHTVNFVIAGHIHAYMRSHPTAFSKRDPRGPIHIIQGNGGRQANDLFYSDAAEEWVDVRDHSMYGYGSLELVNNTYAMWKWIKTGFNAEGEGDIHDQRFDPDLNVHDEIWVRNQLYVEEIGANEDVELDV